MEERCSSMSNVATRQAIYLLGFTPGERAEQAAPRIAGFRLRSTVESNIRCWYVQIDASEFSGPDAEANLENLEWLTPRVLVHQQAVDAIAALGPVLPARFATLFSSLTSLRQHVVQWQNAIVDFFQQVSDKREWGCKVYVRPRTRKPGVVGDSQGDRAQALGRNYLQLRRDEQQAKHRRTELRSTWIDTLEQDIMHRDATVVRRPLVQLDDELAEMGNEYEHDCDKNDDRVERRTLIGNLAILAYDQAWPELADLIRSSQSNERCKELEECDEAVEVELTGPFVPYSFCPSLPSLQPGSA
jgi:hypothetical protein